jgi:hypothetical protein
MCRYMYTMLQFSKIINLQYVYIQIYATQITCVVFPLISILLLLYSRCDSLWCSEFRPFQMQKKCQEPSNEHFKQNRGGMMEMININLSVAKQFPLMSGSPRRCSYDCREHQRFKLESVLSLSTSYLHQQHFLGFEQNSHCDNCDAAQSTVLISTRPAIFRLSIQLTLGQISETRD